MVLAADMLAYEGFKHITNTVVKAEQRRSGSCSGRSKLRIASIAYAAEENVRRWRDLYKDEELPPWRSDCGAAQARLPPTSDVLSEEGRPSLWLVSVR